MIPGLPQRQETAGLGEGEEYELSCDARFYDVAGDAKLVNWRSDTFLRLGFTPFQSHTMAIRRDIDREEVERLLKAGAVHSQIVAILL